MLVGAIICDRLVLERCDSAREIREEQNYGAAALEFGCHIANGTIISSAMGGDSGTWLVGFVSYAIGLTTLVIVSFCYSTIAGYDVFKAIQEHNKKEVVIITADKKDWTKELLEEVHNNFSLKKTYEKQFICRDVLKIGLPSYSTLERTLQA